MPVLCGTDMLIVLQGNAADSIALFMCIQTGMDGSLRGPSCYGARLVDCLSAAWNSADAEGNEELAGVSVVLEGWDCSISTLKVDWGEEILFEHMVSSYF